MMYYLPQPPLFLLFVGFAIGITCGLAFQATLKDQVNSWRTQPPQKAKFLDVSVLQIPFIGTCVGICIFLAAGLEVFIYSRMFSYALALPLTLFTGNLVWTQLQKLIIQLLQGGSKSLDLDAYF